MERIAGENNWKLIIRREAEGVTLLQALTCDTTAILPGELLGLPVTALGNHALTPNRSAPAGEEVLITCGPISEDWDNRRLEDLTLPPSLTQAGDYAFFNCRALKRLQLSDNLRHWGGGALMNCRALDTFYLTCTGNEGELLAYFAGELSRELDVTLHRPGGETVRLIFPEYAEVFEENVPHHQFDYSIWGGGYAYHHCFQHKKLDLRAYDALWKGYLGMEYDPDCAVRLAFHRLRHPAELAEKAREDYLSYLRYHVRNTARWLLTERDAAGLQFLLDNAQPDREALANLCTLARAENNTEALAILLEEQHRRFPAGLGKTFDL